MKFAPFVLGVSVGVWINQTYSVPNIEKLTEIIKEKEKEWRKK